MITTIMPQVGKVAPTAIRRNMLDVWDPEAYCCSYRYKVKVGHNSQTCENRPPGHKTEATHSNIMKGKELNKNWKPKK